MAVTVKMVVSDQHNGETRFSAAKETSFASEEADTILVSTRN